MLIRGLTATARAVAGVTAGLVRITQLGPSRLSTLRWERFARAAHGLRQSRPGSARRRTAALSALEPDFAIEHRFLTPTLRRSTVPVALLFSVRPAAKGQRGRKV